MNNYKNIPEELKVLPNWVCFKNQKRGNKTTKVPYNPLTGGNASHSNPKTWTSFEKALSALSSSQNNYDGLGFNFSNSPFTGVDLDHCIKDGAVPELTTVSELAEKIIKTFASYAEISPSGQGVHIIIKGSPPCGIKGRKNSKLGLEIYSKERYFTMTGNVFSNYNSIREDTGEIKAFLNAYFKDCEEVPQRGQVNSLLEDEKLLKMAGNSSNCEKFNFLFSGNWEVYYSSQSEADQALCNILAFWTGKDITQMDRLFRQSGLMRDKWDEKHSGDKKTYGEMTIEKAVRDVLTSYDPNSKEIRPKIIVKKGHYAFTDKGNAERFLDNFRNDLRYLATDKAWYLWDEKRWAEDITGKIYIYVRALIDSMEDECRELATEIKKIESNSEEPDSKEIAKLKKELKSYQQHVSKSANASKMQAITIVAQTFQGIPILPKDLNKDNHLLNVQNGIINLRTGELLPHDKNKLISKLCTIDYSPDVEYPPLWIEFLHTITCGDKELELYLQKAMGYSLTGDVSEQCFFICQGGGCNGKSTFLETISAILNDYAGNIQIDSLMVKQNKSGSSDIARLNSIRFVTSSEPTQGMRLDEGLIKQLTGGDSVTAAFKFKDEFEFFPVFKLWVSTNSQMIIRGTDKGIWRRPRVIPFNADIPEEKIDKDLRHKFHKGGAGILKWLIDGCLLWRKEGLKNPPAVEVATAEYREEMNVVSRFLEECVEKKSSEPIKASVIYEIFSKWCRSSGEYCPSQRCFGLELGKLGFNKKKTNSGYKYDRMALTERGKEYFLFTDQSF